jgi:hypothetical protein
MFVLFVRVAASLLSVVLFIGELADAFCGEMDNVAVRRMLYPEQPVNERDDSSVREMEELFKEQVEDLLCRAFRTLSALFLL